VHAGVLIRTIHNNTLQIWPSLRDDRGRGGADRADIAQVLDTYPA